METGATHTTVLVEDEQGAEVGRFELGPANVLLSTDQELTSFFREIRTRAGEVDAIGAGMAGLRNERDRMRVEGIAKKIWPDTPFRATNDLETALAAAGEWPDGMAARILLLSGTGSCAYGRSRRGKVSKFGGRGHLLGDLGSACDIALSAMRAVVYQYDLKGKFPSLGKAILAALQLNDPDGLIPWTQEAEKPEIAALAMVVFREAGRKDALARQVIREAADKLADMAVHCAEHLVKDGNPVQFVLAGSVLLKQPTFSAAVGRRLHQRWKSCRVEKLKGEGVKGAVALARTLSLPKRKSAQRAGAGKMVESETVAISQMRGAPTEWRNPRTMHLDIMPLVDAIRLLVDENRLAVETLADHAEDLEWLIRQVVQAFQHGGRLFYVGAGTSGRLGVLDASECPPTFRVPPDLVQGIMAGGRPALWSAVEGAEDQVEAGVAAVRLRGVKEGDVVLGIAASGRTPYVWGALGEAKRLGAVTALLAFHPTLSVPAEQRPERMILVNTGPEPLTGSTRLKAGTATKVFLNILTTMAMVGIGKVRGNLMIDLNPSNTKLRDRAVRLVCELLPSCTEEKARLSLEEAGWVVRDAVTALGGPS